MILGIGTDVVNIKRIEAIIQKYTQSFAQKILSKLEIIDYNNITQESAKIAYIAKRFSAKEAFAKAVGCGVYYLGFKNIHILNDSRGKPYINVDFNLNQYFNLPATIKIHNEISLSDEKEYAVTFALIWKEKIQ
jgi:holo-[acyl-carrier protein] synthase